MKISSFINGLLTGIIIGLLFAPASGEETRRNINKRISDIKDNLSRARENIKEDVTEKLDKLEETQQDKFRQNVHEVINSGNI